MDSDEELRQTAERIIERTSIAQQLHNIEHELAGLVEKYGPEDEESTPLAGLTLIVAAASRLLALTITHEPITSVLLMKDLVFAAHSIREDTNIALKYAVNHMAGNEEFAESSPGDILGQSLWPAEYEGE